MSTQCPHGQLARQCLLCEQAAEIERLTQRNNELLTANGFAELEAEIERLRADNKTLRESVVSAAHTLEQARIWDWMKWHWNINANACERAWKILDAALAAKGERCRQRNR